MVQRSIQSGLNYVRSLLPETLVRSVSTVQTTISRHILSSAQQRSFQVCTSGRREWRGLEASSVEELLEETARVFVLSCHFLTLVLEEDGTVVDSEEFLLSLPNDTQLMVLEKGETWTQNKPIRDEMARLTFDLYKLHPKDFLCCLTVKASVYEIYTLSYDFRCTRMEHVLRWALRCLSCLNRNAAQLLLHTSSLIRLTAEEHF